MTRSEWEQAIAREIREKERLRGIAGLTLSKVKKARGRRMRPGRHCGCAQRRGGRVQCRSKRRDGDLVRW